MTQAFNLSQLANNLNSSGQVDATDGLVNAVPVANGGTGAATTSAARTNLGLAIGTDIPSVTGSGASGTWGINISGNAATATSATNATNATNVTGTVASAATGTTQSNNDNSTKVATTAYVGNMGIGWGQSWTDVIGSRAKDVVYTNSSGKPILVNVFLANVGASSTAYLYVDAILVSRQQGDSTNGGSGATMSAIVPSGSTYEVTGTRTLTGGIWVELR